MQLLGATPNGCPLWEPWEMEPVVGLNHAGTVGGSNLGLTLMSKTTNKSRPPTEAMIALIDKHRGHYGVEPICRVLPATPSTYHEHVTHRRDCSRLSALAQRDQVLKPDVMRVIAENFSVYWVRKVWRRMQRERLSVARCTA
jgi:hypothetical protein